MRDKAMPKVMFSADFFEAQGQSFDSYFNNDAVLAAEPSQGDMQDDLEAVLVLRRKQRCTLFEAAEKAGFSIDVWPEDPAKANYSAMHFTDYHAGFIKVAQQLALDTGVDYRYHWAIKLQNLAKKHEVEFVPLNKA